ncbi:quaternary amine ABC transporter ATP-binding protein [Tomitella gaofuii]|uniref:quaternary amine ABC transporter ATP-binding protein n=1 Tax=Tomitella gaofuii TaxID=2760083 RepID=UPI0015FA1BB6|nr:glycine betaine/L-proline ABC transporter ATP-binding protein [Tomitella gaofuii]
MATVKTEKLYKVFGRNPDKVVAALEGGAARSEIDTGGATAAVIDANLDIREGETFVVMGLSGSGKSTLLRMLNGLLPATSGRVLVGGEDLTAMSDREARHLRRRTMSMVFQHFALFPHRTVLDNAAYGLQIQGVDKAERRRKAARALELTGLAGWEDHMPGQLSGGMQQRVGLARALAAETDILLMDEAFSALDPLIRRDMQDQLTELQKTLNKTIIFITHDLDEAMRIGDRIAIMRDGRIEQVGTAREILDSPANAYVQEFIQDVDRTRVLTAENVMDRQAVTVTAAALDAKWDEIAAAPGRRTVFVVDESGRPVGVIGSDSADGSVVGTGAPAVDRDVVEVPENASLRSLFRSSATSDHPLAVVDEAGRLSGTISQDRLLGAAGEAAAAPPDPAEHIVEASGAAS